MHMGNLPPLKEAFENKNKLIFAGNLDKWTHGGHTKMKPGGKVELPMTINGITLSLVFHIKSIEHKKIWEMRREDYAGNLLSDMTFHIYDPADKKGRETELTVLELDTENYPVQITIPYNPEPSRLI